MSLSALRLFAQLSTSSPLRALISPNLLLLPPGLASSFIPSSLNSRPKRDPSDLSKANGILKLRSVRNPVWKYEGLSRVDNSPSANRTIIGVIVITIVLGNPGRSPFSMRMPVGRESAVICVLIDRWDATLVLCLACDGMHHVPGSPFRRSWLCDVSLL